MADRLFEVDMFTLLLVSFVLVAVALIVSVLAQKGAMSGVFGSGAARVVGPNSAGTMTWVTSALFGLLMLLVIALNFATR